jgi:quinol monooxygenase YgiN
MFTRFVECHVKPDKKDELTQKLRNDVLPILQKQPGFVDLIGLVSEKDPERIVSVSFWNSKQDAERYQREHYNRITEMLKPSLKRDPVVDTFNVEPGLLTALRLARPPDRRLPRFVHVGPAGAVFESMVISFPHSLRPFSGEVRS